MGVVCPVTFNAPLTQRTITMPEPKTTRKATDAELDQLLNTATLAVTALEGQSDKFGGYARTVWCALSLRLKQNQTLDRLVGMAEWGAEQLAENGSKATKTLKAVHGADCATRNSTGGYSLDVSQMILVKEKAKNDAKVTGIKLMPDSDKKKTLKALSGK
jgi:hypothetical protein